MFNVTKIERVIGDKKITFETGKIALQAHGAVLVSCGETKVLVTACRSDPRENIDYFPLSVDYRERQAAAGRFPGGFMKREGRPSTREILIARCIDRPIRPLFPDGYYDEVQIMANVLSADKDHDPDVLAMMGASAALSISEIPFQGPLGAVKLARVNGEYIINPTHNEIEQSDLNILLGGRREAINMIEVNSKEVPEDVMADAIKHAHKYIVEVCDFIQELRDACGVEKKFEVSALDEELVAKVEAEIFDKLYQAKAIEMKLERKEAVDTIREAMIEKYCEPEDSEITDGIMNRILDKIEKKVVRKRLLEGKRTGNRGNDELRDIECEVGLLPRVHGSAIFSRGETQAIVSAILGTGRDEQVVDGIKEEYGQRFMLHYNFPPYSVGETGMIRGAGRREIGHGALAEKALEMVCPPKEEFVYTIKLISDITGSNGSSSMASVCGGCLALMDAGVPIHKPVAGISIGMVTDEETGKYFLLTDILGEEDHFGDMDFKVAGTEDGITAIQLDIKAEGLPHEILCEAFEQSRKARLKILETMKKTIDKPRAELSKYAPKIVSTRIDPELIGKLIGPGGATIKGIQEETGTNIEIDDDGVVSISTMEGDGHLAALNIIESMFQKPEVGKLYKNAKVVSIKDFGMFLEIAPGVEGLCHISEASDKYIKELGDHFERGQVVPVKLIAIDNMGRLKLSRKAALIELEGKESGSKDGSENAQD
jgi:polyribonucleotide nucleotidyltransferase